VITIRNGTGSAEEGVWYKDAVIYEVHVKAFYDSNDDGIGDFQGLTSSIDYIQDLGATAIWLLPFYPSPMKDDGYDISDFTDVHPDYGSLDDFKAFLKEAHRRGIRVIIELVLNHTSDQHPWFQRARRAPTGSAWREFYVWSDTPDRYKDARIIFQDFENSNWAWDPAAKAYYWHRFYSHQPDLNYANPDVQKAMMDVTDFWLDLGVDGLRLDAVPYLYEREGTNCENLPETHAYLRNLRSHIDHKFKNRMLIAEANQWPEDIIEYFGKGDECHMAFNFPVMPRLFMAIRMEDQFPIVEIIQRTPTIPDICQWSLFLRNHDELSLEMVTDEERDYMYRAYAEDPHARVNLGIRRRLAPLMGNDARKIELMNALLFSLPGTPIIYYGDEIGMGDNFYLGDRKGVRTPMQWSPEQNAGFSHTNPQKLYLPVIIDPQYHYGIVNVESQRKGSRSLLLSMKQLIAMRKRSKAISRGSIEFIKTKNQRVLAFVRRYQSEQALIIANLSRNIQCAEVGLSGFKGMFPVEFQGRTRFPIIDERDEKAYLFSLGPYGFYWFSLEPAVQGPVRPLVPVTSTPALRVKDSWKSAFEEEATIQLGASLAKSLPTCRWFGGKARTVQNVHVFEIIPVPKERPVAYFTLLNVEYGEGDSDSYTLPLSYRTEQFAKAQNAGLVPLEVDRKGELFFEEGQLYDALWNKDLEMALISTIANNGRLKGKVGEIAATGATAEDAKKYLQAATQEDLEIEVVTTEQSNTSIQCGNKLMFKVLRRIESGIHPELEIGRFLTERVPFKNTPRVLGSLDYRPLNGNPITLAILYEYVANQGDAWQYTLQELERYYKVISTSQLRMEPNDIPAGVSLLSLIEKDAPSQVVKLIGPYLDAAALLGRRTAELHIALAKDEVEPDFIPEEFSHFYQRSLYHEMLMMKDQSLQLLREHVSDLNGVVQEDARNVLGLEEQIERRYQPIRDHRLTGKRIRNHGDYHLGQVLYTGSDFVIIDFEGEPTRPLSERRLKRSALRDVAGMLRSFNYASFVALSDVMTDSNSQQTPELGRWARLWRTWVSTAYLRSYLTVAKNGVFLPQAHEEIEFLLNAYLLQKALYELAYELNNRPKWVRIPLQGILELLVRAS
jgi:maltose alpha-D-glucosyltransferase/alpha-amylase